MSVTKDFENWLSAASPHNHEEVYCLFKAVKDLSSWGSYDCSRRRIRNGVQYLLHADHVDEYLLLASELARNAFMNLIEKRYTADGVSIDALNHFQLSMQKED